MELTDYWQIIEKSREHAGTNQNVQLDCLVKLLEDHTDPDLVDFACHTFRTTISLNTWPIAGAFVVIFGDAAVSIDLHEYFLSALIMQGRNAVNLALTSPDLIDAINLIPCEGLPSVSTLAWKNRNPDRSSWEFLHDLPELTGLKWNFEPSGDAIDVSDMDVLQSMYPRLWQQFGKNPKRPY